ncbi:hypothetical protein D3C72_1867700 [compost metagenome]
MAELEDAVVLRTIQRLDDSLGDGDLAGGAHDEHGIGTGIRFGQLDTLLTLGRRCGCSSRDPQVGGGERAGVQELRDPGGAGILEFEDPHVRGQQAALEGLLAADHGEDVALPVSL